MHNVITLAHNTPSCTSLPNGWLQVSFTLNMPFTLEIGARLCMGMIRLAPWRIDGQHIACLALPSEIEPDLSQAIRLERQGISLMYIEPNQPLLITGEGLAIADVLLAAQHIKHYASHCLILLSSDAFPCVIKPARFMVADLPDLIAACPLLEDWGFANRLVSTTGLAGCFEGKLSQLVERTIIKNQLHYSDVDNV